MPSTRRSVEGSAVLEPMTNDNAPPATPGKQVRYLKSELEKKDAENEALRSNIDDLTKALNGLNIVKEKITTGSSGYDTKDNNSSKSSNANKNNKNKDKDAPVPAKTAYRFFCDVHPKKDGEDMRQTWKETAPEIRNVFSNMAEADKARYQREKKAYDEEKLALEMYYEKKKQETAMEFYEAHLAAQAALEKADGENKKGKKKKKKDPEAPKRPTSSYLYFTMEKRDSVVKENPKASFNEITKILGEMWSHLEKGGKGKNGTKKYDDWAAADKVRYEQEKAAYDAIVAERKEQEEQEKHDRLEQDKKEAMALMKSVADARSLVPNDAMQAVARNNSNAIADNMSVVSGLTVPSGLATNNKPSKKKKDPNAPKRSATAYNFFVKENRAAIKSALPENATNAELLTEIGKQWKDITEKQKAKYIKMAEEDKIRYEKEMEQYNASK